MKNLAFAFALIFLSCSGQNPSVTNYDIDTAVTIYLKDETGNNLLDTPGYNSADFKIYYRVNGRAVEVYNPFMDAPRNFYIINETDPISMRLFANNVASEAFPITYIKWNETDTDTIKAAYVRGENYVRCSNVWLNGALAWSAPSTGGRTITIVK